MLFFCILYIAYCRCFITSEQPYDTVVGDKAGDEVTNKYDVIKYYMYVQYLIITVHTNTTYALLL